MPQHHHTTSMSPTCNHGAARPNPPLNLLYDLPDEIVRVIYSFDPTYREVHDTLMVDLHDPCPHGLAERCREPLCESNLVAAADGTRYYHLVVIDEVSSTEFAAASRQ